MISFGILIYLLASYLFYLMARKFNEVDVNYGVSDRHSKKKLIFIGFVGTPALIIGVALISYSIVHIDDIYNWFITYLP
ncbi:hypothetical protein [Virgibacillus salexigens]|uniref:Uncharacterized protein n=1 Tax=Virgibacillus massiliensis TaxID=1462526 RepID=A0A024QBH6_9BACI|nr:hypothetical protein [Virgibacillus massiliensis]CDQ39535.1 hypothetical protein BN990_01840 [Virgibacillus massiliensis]